MRTFASYYPRIAALGITPALSFKRLYIPQEELDAALESRGMLSQFKMLIGCRMETGGSNGCNPQPSGGLYPEDVEWALEQMEKNK